MIQRTCGNCRAHCNLDVVLPGATCFFHATGVLAIDISLQTLHQLRPKGLWWAALDRAPPSTGVFIRVSVSNAPQRPCPVATDTRFVPGEGHSGPERFRANSLQRPVSLAWRLPKTDSVQCADMETSLKIFLNLGQRSAWSD